MLNFVPRRNGERMADVQITFVVGHYDLATAVLTSDLIDNALEGSGTPRFTVKLSRTTVERLLRERLRQEGPFNCGSRDGYSEAAKELCHWIVAELFPELV